MRLVNTAIAAVGAALIVAVHTPAQTTATQERQQRQPIQQETEVDPAADMMKRCEARNEKGRQALDRALAAVDEARRTAPAEAARDLDRARNELLELRSLMAEADCQEMMKEMHTVMVHRFMEGMDQAPTTGEGERPERKDGPIWKTTTVPGELAAVCGEEIDIDAAPRATFQGQTYYFCTQADREEFEKDPNEYLKRAERR
jgi:YHS domain-containing protein